MGTLWLALNQTFPPHLNVQLSQCWLLGGGWVTFDVCGLLSSSTSLLVSQLCNSTSSAWLMSLTEAEDSDTNLQTYCMCYLFSSFLCYTLFFFSPKGQKITETSRETKQVCVQVYVVCKTERWLLPQKMKSKTLVLPVPSCSHSPFFSPFQSLSFFDCLLIFISVDNYWPGL